MKNRIRRSLHFIEQGLDKFKAVFYQRRGYIKEVQLIPYHGYANHETISIEGRLLKDRGIDITRANESVFSNILRMYKHFGSVELPGVKITATYGGERLESTTDEEGYFNFEIPFKPNEDEQQLWHKVKLEISEGEIFQAKQTGWFQTPITKTQYGIISDIDDTILHTGAANLLQSITITFTKNAATRITFPGVDQLYTALQKGKTSHPINPIFYLSNSPWNLYDFLNEFIELNEIPKGSLLLRDWGIDHEKFIIDDNHKLFTITKVLNTYPGLPFILIGDSSEKDPEYYHKIVQEFPHQILAVYIRDITNEPRKGEVKKITEDIKNLGVPALLMEDSFIAAEHAHKMGWITKEEMKMVRESVWQ